MPTSPHMHTSTTWYRRRFGGRVLCNALNSARRTIDMCTGRDRHHRGLVTLAASTSFTHLRMSPNSLDQPSLDWLWVMTSIFHIRTSPIQSRARLRTLHVGTACARASCRNLAVRPDRGACVCMRRLGMPGTGRGLIEFGPWTTELRSEMERITAVGALTICSAVRIPAARMHNAGHGDGEETHTIVHKVLLYTIIPGVTSTKHNKLSRVALLQGT